MPLVLRACSWKCLDRPMMLGPCACRGFDEQNKPASEGLQYPQAQTLKKATWLPNAGDLYSRLSFAGLRALPRDLPLESV